jgi:type I restriction enzyme S subunit
MPRENGNKLMGAWIWDAACSIHGAVDAPKYKDFILPLIFVKRLDVRKDLAEKMEGSTGRQRLSKMVLDKKRIPKPLLNKQKEISGILFNFDKKIEFHTHKKQKLEELFQTLLHQLMTVQIRVDNLDIDMIERASQNA